ncbi:energy transducer TonB family protein, partial [Ralstonia pseudosolanacearum]
MTLCLGLDGCSTPGLKPCDTVLPPPGGLGSTKAETNHAVLLAIVDETGEITHVMVEQSSGIPKLDQAALAATCKARTKPQQIKDEARPYKVRIPFEFVPPSADN